MEDKFKIDYSNWLMQNYGAKTIYELGLVMKHRYLFNLLDLPERPKVHAIGDIAHEISIQRTEVEVNAMIKYYNENYELIDFDQ